MSYSFAQAPTAKKIESINLTDKSVIYPLTHTLHMVNASTSYYRSNRRTKRVIHKCPHCTYETTNARIQLINHINAKHVAEKDRPYQCMHCARGFAQKAHLDKHLATVHDICNHKPKVASISYIIDITSTLPRSTKTKARREYYKTHKVINTNDINNTNAGNN